MAANFDTSTFTQLLVNLVSDARICTLNVASVCRDSVFVNGAAMTQLSAIFVASSDIRRLKRYPVHVQHPGQLRQAPRRRTLKLIHDGVAHHVKLPKVHVLRPSSRVRP